VKSQHETGDDRDNRRVVVWSASAAIGVFLGARAYLYAVDEPGETLSPPTPMQSASQLSSTTPPAE
jgi:hypothetical protein